MARIKLDGMLACGKLRAKKSSLNSRSKRYKMITEEANNRIDEGQRRYADAYQRASTFFG